MYYIHSISSISHQNTFRNSEFIEKLSELEASTELVTPEFKELLPPTALRRLSPILKISLTTALECKTNDDFDAIIVGTALGCLQDTEKFLVTIQNTTSDVLSPTSFIQSTHNTIGGQISLFIKNHGYNMTHTQNSLSFEISVLDAIISLKEDKEHILVGAADEKIDFLKNLQPKLISDKYPLTSLATFFNLKNDTHSDGVYVKDVYVNFNSTKEILPEIDQFLEKNQLTREDLEVLYHSDIDTIEEKNAVNFLPFSGLNYSASALAFHFGYEHLKKKETGSILIVNNMCQDNLGLTLIQK